MILVMNSKNAPIASLICPVPSNKPQTVKGGKSATATITPITAEDKPVVNASTPAHPEARARIISERFARVLIAISGMVGSVLKNTPYRQITEGQLILLIIMS